MGLLELQDGFLRHGTVLAIDVEQRVSSDCIQRRLEPFYPNRIKHRRRGCCRREFLVNAWKFLFTDLSQKWQEITRVFLDGLDNRLSNPNRFLNLRRDVD